MATATKETALALLDENAVATFEAACDAADAIGQELEEFRITDRNGEVRVNELLAGIKVAAGNLEHTRTRLVKPWNDKVRAINDYLRRPKEILEKLEGTAKRKLQLWLQQEQERIAREQAEARRKAEEAARAASEAEEKRIKAEQERQAALKRAEEAKNSKAREAALAKAREADQAAQAAAAKEQEATTSFLAAREAEPMEAPRGVRTDSATTGLRERWTFKVVDPALVPREFLVVSDNAIREALAAAVRTAKAAGKTAPELQIAGVEIYAEDELATRIRR